jgi:hypothetical protein
VYRELDVFGRIGRDPMTQSSLYEEIKDEGRLEMLEADDREVLESRFGAEGASQFDEKIHGIAELDRLKHLHRRAVVCDSIRPFAEELTAPRARRRRQRS